MKNELLDRKESMSNTPRLTADVRVCSEKYSGLEAMCIDSTARWISKKLTLAVLENGEMETGAWVKRLNAGDGETITLRLLDNDNRKIGHIVFLGCKLSEAVYGKNNGVWLWTVVLDYEKTKIINNVN